MYVLGIETSCDDTAAAVVDDEATVLANVISSQDHLHGRFGGIVPELASRRHIELISVNVDHALAQASIDMREIGLVSVTRGPGLIGSLLVGFSYAKSLAYTLGIPFIGVDHMAGHLLSVFLEDEKPSFPYIALIVSGGTTALFKVAGFTEFELIGSTRDDAAGEAFDKIARFLSLGYPGGPVVSQQAETGNPDAVPLPRSWLGEDSYDFSFSGLKTSVLNHCGRLKQIQGLDQRNIDDICASFQQAVIDVLVRKTIDAALFHQIDTVVLGGGVSANQSLRHQMNTACAEHKLKLHLPALMNCTDNGAMIAFAGIKKFESEGGGSYDNDVFSRSPLGR